MATLRELYDIESDSKGALDDPDPAIAGAADIRARLKMAMRVHARTLLNGGTLPLASNPGGVYPDANDGEQKNNAIAWAQSVVKSPERVVDELMGLALAGAEGITAAQILARTDVQLKDGIIPLIPLLAKGLHPGR